MPPSAAGEPGRLPNIPPVLRRLLFVLIVTVAVAPAALGGQGRGDDRTVEVVDLRGPLDDRLADFALEAIRHAASAGTVEVVVLQVDSPGVVASAGRFSELADAVKAPPLPLVVWVGPEPARAYGGVAQLLAVAPVRTAAPGTEIGYLLPTLTGRDGTPVMPDLPTELVTSTTIVEGRIPGLVDETVPSLRQLLQELDGRRLRVADGEVVLSTVRPFVGPDGEPGVTVLPTVIRQPDPLTRLLRLPLRPEVTLFLLVAGLAVAAFEFYAIGPGLAAAVAAISLGLAGYGLAVLPVRWWVVAVVVAALATMTFAYQRGGSAVLTWGSLATLTVAGFFLVDGAPQVTAGAAGVVLTVAAAAFFFVLAMPTVARSRLSTPTIGRESLVGRTGVAVDGLDPDGVVEVDGARWQATSHREAGLRPGDPIVVVAVDGWTLEVDRPEAAAGEREKRAN